MRRFVPFLGLAVAACAPAQPPATQGCTSLADCPLYQVCDESVGQCIAEPSDRFLGSFQCTVFQCARDATTCAVPQSLQLSEIVGHIADDRWSVTSASCALVTGEGLPDELQLQFTDLLGSSVFEVTIEADHARAGQIPLELDLDAQDSAFMLSPDTDTLFGSSTTGYVVFETTPTLGDTVSGYLDVSMVAAASAAALFGAACPQGLADCGSTTSSAGGVEACVTIQTAPMCTSICAGNGDCALGSGAVCIDKQCTRTCASDADCGTLKCVAGTAGEGSGCF